MAVVTRVVSLDRKQIELFDARTGASHATVPVPPNTDAFLGASGRWIVFSTGRTIRLLDSRTRATSVLATAGSRPIGLSVSGRRVAWAENIRGRGRIRALTLPR